jgi:membrane protein YqaA with SNARE-associated domain
MEESMGHKKHYRVAKKEHDQTVSAFDQFEEKEIALAIIVIAILAALKGAFIGYILGSIVCKSHYK